MKLFEIPMFVASVFGFGLVAGLDTPPAYADFTFGEPVNLRTTIPVIDPVHESIVRFSFDGLEMYIASDRPGGQGGYDLWVLTRVSEDEDWSAPQNLGPAINSSQHEGSVAIEADGLTLYFNSLRPGGQGQFDLYMATRMTKSAPWGSVVNLGPKVNSSSGDYCPCISADGLELYFTSGRPGGYGAGDLYVTRRATTNEPWGGPINLGPVVNSPYEDAIPTLSPDGLLLVFSDNFQGPGVPPRPGGYGGSDMWMTRRASLSSPWQAPVNLGPQVNSPMHEIIPLTSPDDSMLIFTTNFGETWDNWQAPIIPIVDFNGDGKIDGKEVLALAEHWGENKSLFDIGLSPLGDGIVDANDLIVLAGYIGQEVNDPTLIAHWALDETEGITAHDSAGGNDGTVVGNAAWRPEEGKVGGALAFDGVDDLVLADSPGGPGDGPFGILAWVQGGAPGQVVLGQSNGSKWLYMNPIDGSLATDLKSVTRGTVGLSSEAVITDGQWHRIAVVWDGTDRILYADEEEVARDAQAGLTISDGGLLIGAGTRPGTFWSGLIDDVRIYNRAVQP